MSITTFESLYDTRPHLLQTFKDLTAPFKDPVITKDKYGAWMYCASVFIPGTTRGNANVQFCTLLIADIDSSSEESVEGLLERLIDSGIEFAFHTTHSYKAGLRDGVCKCRILFPLSRHVEPHEWDPLWCGFRVFIEESGCKLDPQCRDPSHAYFAPSAERPEECLVHYEEGFRVDVELLLEISPKEARKQTTFKEPSPELLARIESSVRYQLAKRLLEAMSPAVEGQGGDNRTFVAACVGHDYALTEEEFWPLLVEYNKRCEPPWDEEELKRKLSNAYKYSTLPQGWRLVGEGQDDVVEAEDVKKLITRLLKFEKTAALGRTMRSMLSGEALVAHDPTQTLLKVGQTLGRYFPQAFPKQIAALFEECIEATEALDAKNTQKRFRDITLDALMTHIRTAQEDRQALEAARRLQIQDVLALKYARAFRAINVARATPYTDEEIVNIRKKFAREAEGDKVWIVRHGDSYYFRVLEQYVGPFGRDAWNAAATYLSPVPDIALYEYTPNGKRARSMSSLVEEYGVVAHKVVVNMTKQTSTYDSNNFIMYEAPCPIRYDILEAQPHHNVDQWLLHFCGSDTRLYERLLDWLATFLKLEQPTAALIAYGKAQTGKSLLGNALSRLFTDAGPTEIEDVSGNFNSHLAKCPVTMADETVPQENRQPNTRLLRKLITAHHRTYRRKFIPDAELIGAMRLIMTANNLEGLISFENVTEHDVEALCERFLLIKIDTDAPKRFLDSLSKEDRRDITHGYAVAEHVLWLAQTREVKAGQRLLVEGFQDSSLREALRSGTGVRPEVVEFVANWICNKQLHRAEHHPLVYAMPDGTMAALMTVHTLKEHWKTLVGDNVPRLTHLRKALEALSFPRQVRVKSRNYWQVDIESIKQFALSQGFDEDEFTLGMRNLGLLPQLAPGTLPIK